MEESFTHPRGEVVRMNLRRSFEHELTELRTLYTTQAQSIQAAFSPDMRQLLRRLSEEEEFFQYYCNSVSSDTSSRTADITATTLGEETPSISSAESTPDHWKPTRTLFEFIFGEFMPAPPDQQLGVFQKFLDEVKGKANRIKFPGRDATEALEQCVKAVKTFKNVIGTKFASFQSFVESKMNQGNAASTPGGDSGFFADPAQNEDPDPADGVNQNVPDRKVPIGHCRAGNPGVTKVITENPIHPTGNTGLSRAGPSVIKTIQANPASSSPHGGVPEDDLGGGSPSTRKPYPLKRQSHVMEEEEE